MNLNMRMGLWVLMMAVVVGCATVTSTTMGAATVGEGMTYYLPKREIKISAERVLLKKQDLEKALASKKTELDATNVALRSAVAAVKTATDRLASPAVTGNHTALAQVERELAIAKADEEIIKAKIAKIEIEIAGLEANILVISNAPSSSCTFQYSAKIELLPAVADTGLRFVANPSHSVLRDDDTKLQVTSSGLLSSANIIAADRTGDIIVEFASAIASGGAHVLDIRPQLALEERDALTCEQMPLRFAYSLDPADPADVSKANQELSGADFPFRINVPVAKPVVLSTNSAKLNRLGEEGALFYRSAVPLEILLQQCKGKVNCSAKDMAESVPIDAVVLMLPQAGPISYVPMQSSAFVKTADDVVFENGMLVSWSASRPSEALEVVRLPVKLLKSVMSVPAELIKLRIDLSDQQKGLAASQQAQIVAQKRLAIIKACIEAAGADSAAALACFQE